jgi:nicotinate-nucleotide adenylyltransferase
MVNDYEFHLPLPSYTWSTLCHLRTDYPHNQFVLLIGSENWAKFNLWFAHDKIVKNYEIAVYPREEWPVDVDALPPNVHLLQTPFLNISSTVIRQRIKEGKPISEFVPKAVERIILEKGYYKD